MVRGTRTVLPSPSATWLQPTAGGGGGGRLGNHDAACVFGEHMVPPCREGGWEIRMTHACLENT